MSGDHKVRVSPISAWELGLLSAKGRMPTAMPPSTMFRDVAMADRRHGRGGCRRMSSSRPLSCRGRCIVTRPIESSSQPHAHRVSPSSLVTASFSTTPNRATSGTGLLNNWSTLGNHQAHFPHRRLDLCRAAGRNRSGHQCRGRARQGRAGSLGADADRRARHVSARHARGAGRHERRDRAGARLADGPADALRRREGRRRGAHALHGGAGRKGAGAVSTPRSAPASAAT